MRLKPLWRKRYVCGLRSKSTQKRLLSEADLTLARAVEIAQSMEAAHKNAQALKGPELPVRRLEKLLRKRVTSNAKQEVKEGGSLATVVVKGGIYRTSVASGKPPAIMHLSMLCPTSPHQSQVGIRAGICRITLTPPMGHLIFPYTILHGIRIPFNYTATCRRCLKVVRQQPA